LIKFFFGVILIINSLELINAIRYRQVPYTSWIPPHHPLVIEYTYLVAIAQVILTTFDLSISFCLEVLPITFIGMASVLLTELSERMESFIDEKTDDEKDYLELKTCVQHHQRISDYVKRTEELFSIMLFLQGFFQSLYLCFFIYFLSKVRFDCTFVLRDHVLWISSDRRGFYFHHTVLDLGGCHSCHISAISNWTASDHRVREVEWKLVSLLALQEKQDVQELVGYFQGTIETTVASHCFRSFPDQLANLSQRRQHGLHTVHRSQNFGRIIVQSVTGCELFESTDYRTKAFICSWST
jgi:hypothetical protein